MRERTAKSGGTTAVRLYCYGVGLVSEQEGGIVLYHHYDNLGSTVLLTDGSGREVQRYSYGAYGELLSGDASYTSYLYNGSLGVSTDENGLYYMRARYYNPEIKRFVNQDVVTGSITNTQSLNTYSYVQGNPVSYTDPFGLSPLSSLFKGTSFAHTVLGLLGMIPGPLGIAANTIDAFVYGAVDHDYFMMGMSLLNMVTQGGAYIAQNAGSMFQCAKTAKYVEHSFMLISRGASFVQKGVRTANIGMDMYYKYVVNGEKAGWETVGEAGMFLLNIFGMSNSVKGISQEIGELKDLAATGPGICFAAGTLVLTETGCTACYLLPMRSDMFFIPKMRRRH